MTMETSSSERRRKAMDTLMPSWLEARTEAARAAGALAVAKERHKARLSDLAQVEGQMEHVADCHWEECLRCEELVLNGVGEAAKDSDDGDESEEDATAEEQAVAEDLSGWEEVREPLALPPGEVIEAEAVVVG